MAGADRLLGPLGGQPRIVGIDVDEGAQLGLEAFDAGQQRLDHVDGREPPGRDLPRQDMGRQISRIRADARSCVHGGYCMLMRARSTNQDCGEMKP